MIISTKILDELLPDRTTWHGENRQSQLIVAAVVIWDVAAVKEDQRLCVYKCSSLLLPATQHRSAKLFLITGRPLWPKQ